MSACWRQCWRKNGIFNTWILTWIRLKSDLLPFLTLHENQLKIDHNLNEKPETMKSRKQNIGAITSGQFASSKSRIKRQLTEGEKTFANCSSNKEIISRTYKNSSQGRNAQSGLQWAFSLLVNMTIFTNQGVWVKLPALAPIFQHPSWECNRGGLKLMSPWHPCGRSALSSQLLGFGGCRPWGMSHWKEYFCIFLPLE